LHSNKHLTRQVVDVTARKKKNKSAPVRIAPITLAIANSRFKKTMVSKIVPTTPKSSAVIILHKPWQQPSRESAPEIRVTASNTTETPKSAHKKTGAKVMVPVILRNAVIIPMIRLTTTATNVQPGLKHLHDVDIKFHLPQHFMQNAKEGESMNFLFSYRF
jgi:hypothetical protein